MKHAILVAVGMLMVPISVLGYGYWLGVSHGSLSVHVTDVSDREHSRPVLPVALVLLNAEGRALAEARAAEPLGTVYLSSPAPYSCWDVEQRAPFSVGARNEWGPVFRASIPLDPNVDQERQVHRSSFGAVFVAQHFSVRVGSAGHMVALVGADAPHRREAL